MKNLTVQNILTTMSQKSTPLISRLSYQKTDTNLKKILQQKLILNGPKKSE